MSDEIVKNTGLAEMKTPFLLSKLDEKLSTSLPVAIKILSPDDEADVSPDVTRLIQLFDPSTPVLPPTFLDSVTVEQIYETLNNGSSSVFETNFVCVVSDSGSYEGSVHLSNIMTAWKGETLSKLLKHRKIVTQMTSNTDIVGIVDEMRRISNREIIFTHPKSGKIIGVLDKGKLMYEILRQGKVASGRERSKSAPGASLFASSFRGAAAVVPGYHANDSSLSGYAACDSDISLFPSKGDKSAEAYFEKSVFQCFLDRIPWIGVLLLVNFLSQFIQKKLKYAIDHNGNVATFLTLIIGSGGNIAAQSSTVFVRALSSKNMGMGHPLLNQYIRHEGLVCFLIITVVLAATFSYALVSQLLDSKYDRNICLYLPVTVTASLSITCTLAAMISVGLPIFIKRYTKFDPALISAPLAQTFLDVGGGALFLLAAKYFMTDVFHCGDIGGDC